MAENEQNNRKKGSLHRRDEGLGTGPVGNGPRGEKAGSAQQTQTQHTQQVQQTHHQQSSGYQQSSQSSQSGWQNLNQTPNQTGHSQNLQQTQHQQSSYQQTQSTGWQQSTQQSTQQTTQNLQQTPNETGRKTTRGGRLKGILIFIAVVIGVIILFKACGGCGGCGGSDYTDYNNDPYANLTTAAPSTTAASLTTQATENTASEYETYGDLSSILAGLGIGNMIGTAGTGSYDAASDLSQFTGDQANYNGWTDLNGNSSSTGNTGTVNTQTVTSARSKYTTIKGGGQDTVTVMVFMCGTDLESNYKMGTSDLQEMLNSGCGGNVNLIIYTGGCKKWQNNVISNQHNQIYQVKNGQLTRLSDNAGTGAMTDPKTLSDFIKVCAQNFPANRYELILWDHGGGSVSGYGYDEKQSKKDTMDLSEISKALKDGGVKFDMIGFDACLMATAETALMLDAYGDYMVASEEAEPGIGWYYTEWLRQLTQNPSMDTVTLGKKIADDFVMQCGKSCRGQATTLSVVDLAEFAAVVPAQLSNFATSTAQMISSDYQTVSNARSRTHEFASSSRIDQIDLVHFAKNLGTTEGKNLANALLSAIKYNTTSSDVTNAYGISIFFPYRNKSYVDAAIRTYNAIGLDSAYSKCIQSFASVSSSGQLVTGGTSNYASSVFDMLSGGSQQSSTGTLLDLLGGTSSSSSYSSSSSSSDLISGLLGSYLGGGSSSSSSSGSILGSLLSGMSDDNSSFLFGRAQDPGWIEDTSEYIADHMIEREKFNWTKNPDGESVLALTKDDWALLTDLQTSVYYDDGAGYIDLGTDQIYSFDKYGNLAMPSTGSWMAVVGIDEDGEEVEQPVVYYLDSVVRNGSEFTLKGHIPVLVNVISDIGSDDVTDVGMLGNLLVLFDNQHPKGYISGLQLVYNDGTEVQAKNIGFGRIDENTGKEIPVEYGVDFICDYYGYDGKYQDSYRIGDSALWIREGAEIVSFELESKYTSLMYRFTDIYDQVYWSEATR